MINMDLSGFCTCDAGGICQNCKVLSLIAAAGLVGVIVFFMARKK